LITAAWSSPRTAGSPPPPDGGARWLVVFKAGDGGAAFNDLGFTTTADGVAVYGPVYQNDNTYGLPGKLLPSSDGGAAFNDLGFTTTADGVAVYGPVYQNDNTYGLPGKLLLSSDGGASWQATVFLAGPAGPSWGLPQAKMGPRHRQVQTESDLEWWRFRGHRVIRTTPARRRRAACGCRRAAGAARGCGRSPA